MRTFPELGLETTFAQRLPPKGKIISFQILIMQDYRYFLLTY